jgi:hypothetical protein
MLQQGFFNFVPINRLVTGAFKTPIDPKLISSLCKLTEEMDSQSNKDEGDPKSLKKLASIENVIATSSQKVENKKAQKPSKKSVPSVGYYDPNNHFSILA